MLGKRKVTILCSGFGLGFYVPGLLLDYQLNRRNVETEVMVFENFIEQDKKEKINDSRRTYHDNFKMALLASKIPNDIRNSLAFDQITDLIEQWKQEERQDFIVLSGHWVYILDMLREQVEYPLNVHLIYVDSAPSPSWSNLMKYKADYAEHYREIWLYDSHTQEINYRINVTEEPIVPYRERSDRFLIHGGGWGMGTYQGKIPELEEHGILLDIIAYDLRETESTHPNNRFYMMDPAWNAWDKGANERYRLPPFSEIKANIVPEFRTALEHHGSYDILKRAKGVISKPGGGTLIDSLASATPMIFLEPFGKHEQKNTDLWLSHGLGIRYEDWKDSGYSLDLLEPIHHRLVEQKEAAKDYVDEFLESFSMTKKSIV
ncbi:UDP-glucuronosyltransferase [Paenibacillus monticola]|uniref:UDP-glucuronosyltransferase n=1 Tax=Paenibacillus monticola TaxID=2666075 RepID=A0A7X2L5U2_9BACL|nr:UDP-glucuronosyltransferase [Paenibacillus monticola]MRN57276.1 UDP-glucuronosyltransferase [Paenibacillus monticola]